MPSPYEIIISNGTGSTRILNGSYTVAAEVAGYEGGSVDPSTQIVSAGVDTYDFTVAASGTLTLHVTEDGAAGIQRVEPIRRFCASAPGLRSRMLWILTPYV